MFDSSIEGRGGYFGEGPPFIIGDARRVRALQMAALREHMRTHNNMPAVAVGDFNHVVQPQEGEIFKGASNNLDGALTWKVDGNVHITYPEPKSTDISDHALMIVSVVM